MKDISTTFTNQLEFTILGLDEYDTTTSPSPDLVHNAVDEEISTELLSQTQKDDDTNPDEHQSPAGDCHNLSAEEEAAEQLAKLKIRLEEREAYQESSLLQNLRAMKEEAWAKRKARKLKREMRRVHFQDDIVSPFCRSCCAGRNNEKNENRLGVNKEESETHSTSSGESWDDLQIGKDRPTIRIRPIAHIHSINMFENIIPRSNLENRFHPPSFMPCSMSLTKMLAILDDY